MEILGIVDNGSKKEQMNKFSVDSRNFTKWGRSPTTQNVWKGLKIWGRFYKFKLMKNNFSIKIKSKPSTCNK